jgi:AraC-like DNA-binding protein
LDIIRLSNPAPPLREFVRFYAHREVRVSGAPVVHPVPARAFPILEFLFGDRIQVIYPGDSLVETSPRAVVVGPQTHCRSQLKFQGAVESFVILFQPAGLHRLFSIPIQELTNRAYEAHSVLGASVAQLEQMLGAARTFPERVRMADRCLVRHALKSPGFDRISAAAGQMLSASGNSRVSEVAADSGLSVRQFERCFVQQLGVNPKLFARIVRFEAALDSKARSSIKSWTDVAHEFGYYDQMHMVHDFDIFTGGTPTKILGEIEILFREQIQAIRSGRHSTNPAGDPQLIL